MKALMCFSLSLSLSERERILFEDQTSFKLLHTSTSVGPGTHTSQNSKSFTAGKCGSKKADSIYPYTFHA